MDLAHLVLNQRGKALRTRSPGGEREAEEVLGGRGGREVGGEAEIGRAGRPI
jgi:hypothetical protein